MSDLTPSPTQIDTLNLFQLLFKWKKTLLLIGVLCLALSFIFTLPLFIKPKFKSFAIIYPSNLNAYSTESSSEQMLQLMQSDNIRNALIKDFDLFRHYDIDPNGRYALTELLNEMKSNISVNKTEYESIELTVWDTDPVYAKNICDSVISKMNHIARALQKEKTMELYVVVRNQYENKKHELDSLDAALKEIRMRTGIFSFAEQSREISQAYYKALVEGKAGNGKAPIDVAWKNFEEHGGEFVTLNEHLNRTRVVYNDYKQYYENASKDLTKDLTYTNVITSPVVAQKKSYPVRSLIIVLFTVSVLFLSFILIVVYENYNKTSPV